MSLSHKGKIFQIQSDLWDVQPGANLKNIQRTSFESDQPLIETPTESRKGFSESYL